MSGNVRMLAFGTAALTDGFALIGFETYPDADCEILNRVLEELVEKKSKALVLVEPDLCKDASALMKRLQIEGGRILIIEIPPLQSPYQQHSDIDELLHSVLGISVLEK